MLEIQVLNLLIFIIGNFIINLCDTVRRFDAEGDSKLYLCF